MALLEFGLGNGLAQDFGSDKRIQDMRYTDAMKRQAEIEASNKAKMFADDFEYNNAMNAFDNNRVKDVARQYTAELGKYIRENPDFEMNLGKRVEYGRLKRRLKDNPDLNRGLQSDANYRELMKDLQERAKNPATFNKEGFDNAFQEWKNYEMYGNQKGKEAADKDGVQAFVYVRPQDFVDLAKEAQSLGNNFTAFNKVHLKGPGYGPGASRDEPQQRPLEALVDDFYSRHKDQIGTTALKAGYKNPYEYAKVLMSSAIKGKEDWDTDGLISLMKERREAQKDMKKNSDYNPWQHDVQSREVTSIPSPIIEKMHGKRAPLFIKTPNGLMNLGNRDIEYPGGNIVTIPGAKGNNTKAFQGITTIPWQEAYDMGMITYFNGTNGDSDDIKPEWSNIATMSKNKKGDPVVQIKGYSPFDQNSNGYAGVYNSAVAPDKYFPPIDADHGKPIVRKARLPNGSVISTQDNGKTWVDANGNNISK